MGSSKSFFISWPLPSQLYLSSLFLSIYYSHPPHSLYILVFKFLCLALSDNKAEFSTSYMPLTKPEWVIITAFTICKTVSLLGGGRGWMLEDSCMGTYYNGWEICTIWERSPSNLCIFYFSHHQDLQYWGEIALATLSYIYYLDNQFLTVYCIPSLFMSGHLHVISYYKNKDE